MKILITGGCGFIGGALVRKLLSTTNNTIFNIDKLGYASDTQSIDSFLTNKNRGRYNFLKINLNDRKNLNTFIKSIKPDLIMHLAAESHVDRSISSPEIFIESNIIGTFNLLEVTREYYSGLDEIQQQTFKFHHISTDEVFGSLGEIGAFSEDTAYDPRSPYSASKASSDHLVRAWNHTFKIPTLITNCSNNFGPWQFPEKLIPLVIMKAINGEDIPIYGDGSNVRDWLYVEDHVDALILTALNGRNGETYCIGGHGETSNKSLVKNICMILDEEIPKKANHENLIKYVRDRPGHDQRYAINSSKIKKELGWMPKYGLENGLRKTVLWYLNNINWCIKTLKRSDYNCERIGIDLP